MNSVPQAETYVTQAAKPQIEEEDEEEEEEEETDEDEDEDEWDDEASEGMMSSGFLWGSVAVGLAAASVGTALILGRRAS